MQAKRTAPDGTAVPSQAPDLETRVEVLEEGLTRVIDAVDTTVALLNKTVTTQGDMIEALLDVSKSGEDER